MLELDGVEVFLGQNRVLRGVSLRVSAGERVAVLGANGAGKSTLIRTILGLNKVAQGRIRLEGREIHNRPPHQIARLGLAQVPEGRRVFRDLSVRDNLRLGAYLPEARKRLPETLAQVTTLFPILSARLDQRAGTLSGGEQQMLSIGRALMSRPRLLLVDEMSLGLAPVIVQEIYRVLGRLGKEVTILLVEQSLEQALGHTERAYILETGRVVREGSSFTLRADPEIRKAYLGL